VADDKVTEVKEDKKKLSDEAIGAARQIVAKKKQAADDAEVEKEARIWQDKMDAKAKRKAGEQKDNTTLLKGEEPAKKAEPAPVKR
jgi:hypothetical protein